MAEEDNKLFDENGNPINGNTDDNSSEFRLATDDNGNETIEAVNPLDAAVVTAKAPKRDNLTTEAQTQEEQTINTPDSPTPEPTRKQERQARRAERKENGTGFFREIGNDAKTLFNGIKDDPKSDMDTIKGRDTEEKVQDTEVTKNPTSEVTENPNDTDANNASDTFNPDEVTVAQGGGTAQGVTRVSPQADNPNNGKYNADMAKPDTTSPEEFNATLEQRQQAFNQNIQNIQNSVDNVTPAPTPTEPEAPVEPETGDEDNTTGTEETQDDSTLTPEQRVEKYGGDADALAKAGYDTAGNPLEAGKEATVGAGADQAYANDPRVQGVQESNAILDEAGRTYDQFYKDFLAEQKAYDEERTRRDSENAFWRGIGEVGASLANLLGVSGAFGGKNAYGKGAYSAMQNFNLTTAGLTDKMKADMDKRRERMNALKERQAQIGLQLAQIRAKGATDLGNAKGAAADTAYNRAHTAEREAVADAHWQAQLELQQQIAADNAKRADAAQQEAARHNREMETINSTKTSGGNDYKNTPFKWEYVVPDGEDGNGKVKYKTKEIECTRETMEKALSSSYRELADCLARMAGYDDYNDFANYPFPKRKNKYTAEDEQRKTDDEQRRKNNESIVKALDTYKNYTNDIESFDDMNSSMQNKFLEWAWNNWFKSKDFGDYIQRKVYNFDYNAQMRDYMNFLTGGGGGETEKNENEKLPDGVTAR